MTPLPCMRPLLLGGLLIILAALAAQLALNHGHFAYALDDTYIYLALAENLPGTYSINAAGQEAGAPASSILYPYLLIPFMHTPLVLVMPLLLNLVAAGQVLILLARLEQQTNLLPTLGPRLKVLALLVFALLLNLVTLIFCGMEHTLHLAAALAVLSGLLTLSEDRRAPLPVWFWLAIIGGPLLRYEALALSLAALLYVAGCGRWRPAVLALMATVAGPIAFGIYLQSLGYSWLPSSVLSKSTAFTAASEGSGLWYFLRTMAYNAVDNLADRPTSWVHFLHLLLLAGLLLWKALPMPKRMLVLVVLSTGVAHLVLGKFGWWGRYHMYIMAVQLITILYVARSFFARQVVLATLLVGLSGLASLWYSVQVPAAAGQIYRNHGLLQSFITDHWKDDVAAYDVGYISWRNPHEVFDLFGLASERVRRVIRSPFAAQVIPQWLEKKGIALVMAQSEFADYYWRPHWTRVAELQLDGRRLTTTTRSQFFLLDPSRGPELREKLEEFAKELPDNVHLHFYD